MCILQSENVINLWKQISIWIYLDHFLTIKYCCAAFNSPQPYYLHLYQTYIDNICGEPLVVALIKLRRWWQGPIVNIKLLPMMKSLRCSLPYRDPPLFALLSMEDDDDDGDINALFRLIRGAFLCPLLPVKHDGLSRHTIIP